ncbi:hypothetical protein EBZ80_09745 [bacterium]|nr:hypothetical protein [bacterium]
MKHCRDLGGKGSFALRAQDDVRAGKGSFALRAQDDVRHSEARGRRILSCLAFLLLAAPTAFAAASTEAVPEATEPVTRIRPEVIYRMSSLGRRASAVFHRKTEDKDFVDQMYATLRFDSTWDYEDSAVFEAGIRTPRSAPNSPVELIIHQAFIESQLSGGRWTLTTGKKVEYDGPGILMNPSDLLNEDKDLIDPLYQREGKFFTRVSTSGSGWKLGLGFIPLRAAMAGKGKAWLQSQAQVAGADLRLQMTSQVDDGLTTGFSASRFVLGDNLEVHVDARQQSRQRDVSVQRERAYSSLKQTDPSLLALAGGRVVVSGKRSTTLEFMQNQGGLTPGAFKDFFAYIASLDDSNADKKPDSRFLGRRYAYLAYHDEDALPKTRVGASVLQNLDDRSTFSSIEIRRAVSPLISMALTPSFFSGSAGSEFGEMPFSSIVYFQVTGRI